MLKKILLGTAILVTTSFATYNFFPVPQAHSGEVQIVSDFTIQDKGKNLDLAAKGRFIPVQNLEIWLKLPFRPMNHWDGNDTKATGMLNMITGLRYQVAPIATVFLDLEFPTGKEAINPDGLKFYFGGQYSADFGAASLGTELGLAIRTEGKDKVKDPLELTLGAELDPSISQTIFPYVGLNLNIMLGDPKFDGHKNGDTSGDVGIFPYMGATFQITPMFTIDFNVTLGFGKDYLAYNFLNTHTPIIFELAFAANF